eukprot:EG_transcript_20233
MAQVQRRGCAICKRGLPAKQGVVWGGQCTKKQREMVRLYKTPMGKDCRAHAACWAAKREKLPKPDRLWPDAKALVRASPSSYTSAVAKEGFAAGQQQFTVHVIETMCKICIGVAVANATRNGRATIQQGVFLEGHTGTVTAPGMNNTLYAADKPVRAGSRVTMRLDFDNRTASYEVDGVDLGVVEGLTLPEGPLHPAVVFFGPGTGEAEFLPAIPVRFAQLV